MCTTCRIETIIQTFGFSSFLAVCLKSGAEKKKYFITDRNKQRKRQRPNINYHFVTEKERRQQFVSVCEFNKKRHCPTVLNNITISFFFFFAGVSKYKKFVANTLTK